MSIQYRFGLFEGAALHEDEVRAVLEHMRAPCITERIEGRFYDVMLEGDALMREPTDPRAVDTLAAFFDAGGSDVSHAEASQAELCVLVPMSESADFRIARSVASVPGWSFKNLETAYASLTKGANEGAEPRIAPSPKTLADLKRASELGVVVVFGERTASRAPIGA